MTNIQRADGSKASRWYIREHAGDGSVDGSLPCPLGTAIQAHRPPRALGDATHALHRDGSELQLTNRRSRAGPGGRALQPRSSTRRGRGAHPRRAPRQGCDGRGASGDAQVRRVQVRAQDHPQGGTPEPLRSDPHGRGHEHLGAEGSRRGLPALRPRRVARHRHPARRLRGRGGRPPPHRPLRRRRLALRRIRRALHRRRRQRRPCPRD